MMHGWWTQYKFIIKCISHKMLMTLNSDQCDVMLTMSECMFDPLHWNECPNMILQNFVHNRVEVSDYLGIKLHLTLSWIFNFNSIKFIQCLMILTVVNRERWMASWKKNTHQDIWNARKECSRMGDAYFKDVYIIEQV